jgi:hypothetical protein
MDTMDGIISGLTMRVGFIRNMFKSVSGEEWLIISRSGEKENCLPEKHPDNLMKFKWVSWCNDPVSTEFIQMAWIYR